MFASILKSNPITSMSVHKICLINAKSTPSILPKRHYSSKQEKSLAKLLVFPITSEKPYLLFKYNDLLLNMNSPLVKAEKKIVGLTTKAWTKLTESDKSYNKKIVFYVNKFLNTTPWIEDSLRSIPPGSALLRQLKSSNDSMKDQEPKEGEPSIRKTQLISQSEIELAGKDPDSLIDIPILFPSSIITEKQLKDDLRRVYEEGIRYHRKQMFITGFFIPLTLPIALIPVVPNIPCFYLCYRFYCNLKAYLGAQRLKDLVEKKYLIFEDSEKLNRLFDKVKGEELKLNEGIIDSIVEAYEIGPNRLSLLKALKQERAKSQSKKIDD